MIPHLIGWTKVFSGESITLYPPEGTQVGGIRYRERVRPLCRTSAVLSQLLARFPQFVESARTPSELLITGEGEYAALVTIAGQVNGQPAQRDVGLVFGDDFYAMLSSLTVVPERFGDFTRSVRTLLLNDSHALGVRRRRYLYTPPEGWQGLPRGFTTEWSPPDFPSDLTLAHVFPANPVNEQPKAVLDQMLADDEAGGFEREEVTGPEAIESQHGLSGQRWRVVGHFRDKPRSIRELVVYKDPRYLYSLRLETMNLDKLPAHRELFTALAQSAHPIPLPGNPERKQVGALVSHWTS